MEKDELSNVRSYPLVYYLCGNCGMFQLLDIVSREELFEKYVYITGVNKELVRHFTELAGYAGKVSTKKDLAIVIGSNDGTEIGLMKKFGRFKRAVGVEPAKNIADIATKNGFDTINAFFTEALSHDIREGYGAADIVTANNVFAHIPNPRDMLLGMKNLINDTGRIMIEVHWLKSLVENLEIEALYTEHYYVWSVKAMQHIANSCQLKVVNVEYIDVHGGSLRFTLMLSGNDDLRLEKDEEEAGLYDLNMMKNLQKRADERKERFRKLILDLKVKGKKISVWSVPAKVPTLLNFCNITSNEIYCAYEVAPTKIGRYIPKAGIEIRDEKLIEKDKPDYLIIGAWNYISLATEKLRGYMERGGKLINPLTCEIIGG
jgi:hypothetical protein